MTGRVLRPAPRRITRNGETVAYLCAILRAFVRTGWAVRGITGGHCVGYGVRSGTVRACAPNPSAPTPAGMAAPAPRTRAPGRPYRYPAPGHAVPCAPGRLDAAPRAATEPNSARVSAAGLSPRTPQDRLRPRSLKAAASTSAQASPTPGATASTGAAATVGSSAPAERSPRGPGPSWWHWASASP